MTAVDTSVVVPALLAWHEHHAECRAAARRASIPAHALLESFAVMTRLPSPHRVTPDVAGHLLVSWFPGGAVLAAPAGVQRAVVGRVVAAGHDGGAVYDALIGLTASAAGERLLTRDRRALALDEALDVEAELLG